MRLAGSPFVLIVAVMASLVAAPAAPAALPGRDGAIAFDSTYEDGEDCPIFGADDDSFEPCTYSLFRVQPSGRKQKRLSMCGTRKDPACGDAGAAWSPDGRRIAFSRDGELWVMRSDGSQQRALGVRGAGPAWSPDGRRIAFTRVGDVNVVDADGTNLRTVTQIGFAGGVAWSSRNRIAFVREIQDRSRELVTMTPEGIDLRVLVPRCRCYGPEFSPRGNEIAYAAGNRTSAVFVMTLRGQNQRRLLGNAGGPAWSPSGRYIAFERGAEIYVARSDGTGARRVPYDIKRRLGGDIAGEYSNPSWQPLPR
jgi:Tol biopolymer transport system component